MTDGPSRRDVLRGIAGAGAVAAVAGSAWVGSRLLAVPTEVENARAPAHAAGWLAGSSPEDWEYNWASLPGYVSAELFGGERAENLQAINPTVGFASTASDGIAAGITRRGRVNALFFPHTGFTPQLPYFAFDWADPLHGAKPWEGSFAGLRTDGTVSWLWEDRFDRHASYRGDTGILAFRYGTDGPGSDAGRLVIDEQTYVLPGEGTLVRDFAIRNRTNAPVDGEFIYHTQANVNDNLQNFVVWESNENRLEATDDLRWIDRDGPFELRIYADGPVTDAGAANTGPTGLMGSALRTRRPAESPEESGSAAAADRSVLDRVLESRRDEVVGRYLSGYLATPIDVEPGHDQRVSIFLTGGPDPTELPTGLVGSVARRQTRARTYWTRRHARPNAGDVAARYRRPFRRAVATMRMLFDPGSGSLSAGGNLKPMYYPSWPRDGAFVSVALSRAGVTRPAKRFLGEFLPSVQEDDGSFKQCYDSRGTFAGIWEIENDQQPIWAWAVEQVYRDTGDAAFLDDAWDGVGAALEYTMAAVADDGLLAAAPDVHEGPTAVRQSLWTNSIAYEGLHAGARLAADRGEDPSRYRRTADRIGDALRRQLFDGDDYATAIGLWGPYRKLFAFDAVALWPSGWARAHGKTDLIARALRRQHRRTGVDWTVGSLLLATALYRLGDRRTADRIVDETLAQRTTTGFLPGMAVGGHPRLGSPLAWASGQLVLALAERSSRSGG